MAELLCELKKKGGGGSMSEIVLWTNPDTTAQRTSGTISLNQSYKNFDLIRIEWQPQISATPSKIMSVYVKPSEFYDTSYLARPVLFLGRVNSGGTYTSHRYLISTSYTAINEKTTESSTTAYNSDIIRGIYGIKI